MSDRLRVHAVAPGDGEPLQLRGAEMRVKSNADVSGGALTCVESKDPPGFAAAPHIHHAATEAFYVLDGIYTFRSGQEMTEASTGSFVVVPAGAVHGYTVGADGGRLLIVYMPAGIEAMWKEMTAAAAVSGAPLTPEQRNAIAARYRIEFV